MKRKSSRSFSRRPRPLPENAPANTYQDSRPQPDMAQVRKILAHKRANRIEPLDMMGAAREIAFDRIGKKPVLTRRQAFEARKAKRGPDNPSAYEKRIAAQQVAA